MTDAGLRYEIEQLKRKLLQTQEERDRAMSNCHELWKRLNSLISLAASTTASYTLSSSGLPTSPSDSYGSRSKSTSPNSSSAASLNDSLLSTSNGTTASQASSTSTHLSNTSNTNNNSSSAPTSTNTNNGTNTLNNNNNTSTNNNNTSNSNNNNNDNNNNNHSASSPTSNKITNGTIHHHHQTPLNLKSVNAIKSNSSVFHNNNNNNNSNTTTNNNAHHQQVNGSSFNNAANNLSTHNHLNNSVHHKPLNLKSVNAIKDLNNNHPLIGEVAKVTIVGDIEEIAPGQFKCRYCDKTFDRIFSVHRHERVHTGFKPCVCKACGRGFSEKRNLRHHIIRFHSDGSGRELLKRNRNKAAQQHAVRQQMKQLSAAASYIKHRRVMSLPDESMEELDHPTPMAQRAVAASTTTTTPSTTTNGSSNNNSDKQSQHQHSVADSNHTNSSLLSNNSHLTSSTSSHITATINRLQNAKNEPIDTSGLNVLGAAAAVITVSSSSSRRRKSKPSKKINY